MVNQLVNRKRLQLTSNYNFQAEQSAHTENIHTHSPCIRGRTSIQIKMDNNPANILFQSIFVTKLDLLLFSGNGQSCYFNGLLLPHYRNLYIKRTTIFLLIQRSDGTGGMAVF